ncbi:lysylphosphatidylglycerol synthase transmembrane domain-containing protein [Actinocorallia longicatena]|uniref:Lysylphosphatidylglycerol synthase-like protein n=1 Tax=Actinocorallia longicatena TaxID=111803 RepID=A0ABP6Q984_9ACTN
MEAVIGALSAMHWRLLPVLGGLAVLHYLFAAIALRAAAGTTLPLRRTMLTQFTAAAASRFTPGGLGGTAVNIRYLNVHGCSLPTAVMAVSAQHAALWAAEVLVLLIAIAFTHDVQAFRLVTDQAAALWQGITHPGVAVCFAAAVVLIVTALVLMARRTGKRAVLAWFDALRDLAHRPRDLCVLMASSLAVAAVLGLAFGLSVLAVPGTQVSPDHLGVLFGAYIVGSAAGSAVPVPGGIGTAEAAFTGALVAVGIAAVPALQAVLIFRAVTFWAPVPVGIAAVRMAAARPQPV